MMTAKSAAPSTSGELVISPSQSSALVFDLDGTMVDNMMFHHQAWQEMLRTIGCDWTLEQVQQRVWGKNEEIMERLFPGRFSIEEARRLTHEKELRYIECYRPHIRLIDGLERLLISARDAGLPLAVATAAPRVCVDFVFEALNLDRFIDVLVQAEDVTLSKPHPETFLTAAGKLGIAPERCIVFEDAPVGVRAANAAQMETYVILTTHPSSDFSDFGMVQGFLTDYKNVHVSER